MMKDVNDDVKISHSETLYKVLRRSIYDSDNPVQAKFRFQWKIVTEKINNKNGLNTANVYI